MIKCRACPMEVIFLKQKKDDGSISDRQNPIEKEPDKEKGNLIISVSQGLYRFATKEEIEFAKANNKNLYVSHFGRCPNAKKFRKDKGAK